MSFQVKAEVLLNNSQWEKNLKKTSKQMEGFGKSMKTISNGVKAAWAGAAAMGIGAIFDGLVDVTKAAANDAKTTALLNKVLDKNWQATDKQKESVSAFIDQMSNLTGVVDDELKPAYANVARQTGSMTKANKMFGLSMDIAADKNISVEKASKLVARAMSGNKKAFDKLYPSASKTGDALGYVMAQTEGLAAAAGQNDPFARINAVMDNFKEKLGMALLPAANKFADWLAGPEAQAAMDQVSQWATDVFSFFTSPEGQAAIKDWYDKIAALVQKVAEIIDKLFQFQDFIDKTPATQGIVPAMEKLVPNEKQRGNATWNALTWGGSNMTAGFGGQGLLGGLFNSDVAKYSVMSGQQKQNVTFNITATNANGADVVKVLKGEAQRKGVPLGQLLK